MKPFESQPTSPNPTPETEFVSCNSIAPLLMELFDGEADEFSTKRARAHLLACEHCAQAWLEWNQTQSILRTHPVPAPPPTLLWRVLLAIRFANFKRQHRFTFFSKKKAPTLGALYGAFEPHEAPASMKAQILAATSRQSSAKSPTFQSETPTSKKSIWPAFSMMAAPALAALLFVVSRGSLVDFPATETVENQTARTEAGTNKKVPVLRESTKSPESAPKAVKKAKAPVVNASVATVSRKAEVESETNEPVVEARSRRAKVAYEPRNAALKVSTPQYKTAVKVTVAKAEVIKKVQPTPAVEALTVAPPSPTIRLASMQNYKRGELRPVVAVTKPSPVKLIAAKPTLSNDLETLTPRVAQLPLTESRGVRSIESRAAHLPTRVTQPVASGPKIVLASYSDDSDEHLNELLTAVADFREVLANDESDDLYSADES